MIDHPRAVWIHFENGIANGRYACLVAKVGRRWLHVVPLKRPLHVRQIPVRELEDAEPMNSEQTAVLKALVSSYAEEQYRSRLPKNLEEALA